LVIKVAINDLLAGMLIFCSLMQPQTVKEFCERAGGAPQVAPFSKELKVSPDQIIIIRHCLLGVFGIHVEFIDYNFYFKDRFNQGL